jgi:hypothetical protein
MGKKLDEAFYQLSAQARHHTVLAVARQTEYDNAFANGFVEALRIVQGIRDGKVTPVHHSPSDAFEVATKPSRRARGSRGNRR